MAALGTVRLNIGGQWDIEDLVDLSEGLKESYAFFYALSGQAKDDVEDRMKYEMQRYFWSGDYKGRHFAQRLYRSIPAADRVKLHRMEYASPGYVELLAVVHVLFLISLVVQSYAKAGDKVMQLIERIDKFFHRRRLARPARSFDASQIRREDHEQAYALMHELGEYLGFSDKLIAQVEELTGNPISGLKMMVALATETRRLQSLEEEGKLRLPKPKAGEDDAE